MNTCMYTYTYEYIYVYVYVHYLLTYLVPCCIFMYTYTYEYIYVYVYVHLRTDIHPLCMFVSCKHARKFVQTHCIHTWWVNTHTYVHTTCIYIHTYIHTYIYIYIHIYIYIYIYMYTKQQNNKHYASIFQHRQLTGGYTYIHTYIPFKKMLLVPRTHTYTHMHTHTCVYMHASTCGFTYTHKHTCITHTIHWRRSCFKFSMSTRPWRPTERRLPVPHTQRPHHLAH